MTAALRKPRERAIRSGESWKALPGKGYVVRPEVHVQMCIADVLYVHGVARGSAGNAESLLVPGGMSLYRHSSEAARYLQPDLLPT